MLVVQYIIILFPLNCNCTQLQYILSLFRPNWMLVLGFIPTRLKLHSILSLFRPNWMLVLGGKLPAVTLFLHHLTSKPEKSTFWLELVKRFNMTTNCLGAKLSSKVPNCLLKCQIICRPIKLVKKWIFQKLSRKYIWFHLFARVSSFLFSFHLCFVYFVYIFLYIFWVYFEYICWCIVFLSTFH